MKRSDAINILKFQLGYSEDKCNEILICAEDILGMHPPILKEKSFKIQDDGHQMTYAVHEWEEE